MFSLPANVEGVFPVTYQFGASRLRLIVGTLVFPGGSDDPCQLVGDRRGVVQLSGEQG